MLLAVSVFMRAPSLTRAEFIDRVLTSSIAGQKAKRYQFADGEVAAVYTLSRKTSPGTVQPVILYVATFPPALTDAGFHDFGIDHYEQPVTSTEEALALLAQFDQQQAAQFRASCRVL